MKKILFLLALILSLNLQAFSQKEPTITITNTKILIEPDTLFLDTVAEIVYQKYLFVNQRSTPVEVKDITTPIGFFAYVQNPVVGAKKKTFLYVGLDPSRTETTGNFKQKIVVKTNLIKPVEIFLKGFIPEAIDDEN